MTDRISTLILVAAAVSPFSAFSAKLTTSRHAAGTSISSVTGSYGSRSANCNKLVDVRFIVSLAPLKLVVVRDTQRAGSENRARAVRLDPSYAERPLVF